MANPQTTDFFARHPVFTHEEYLSAHGAGVDRSPRTADSLLTRHSATGQILHIRRGIYAVVPAGVAPDAFRVDPFLLATKLAPDAVVGYHAALQLRGKACSVRPRFAVLTRSHVRALSFQGNELIGVHPPRALDGRPELGGGVVSEAHAGGIVRVTSLERTLVDVLDCPELGGGWEEIWRSLQMLEKLDLAAVVDYALALGSALTIARVGFFLDQHRDRLRVGGQELAALRERAPRQPRYLDGRREAGRLVKAWNLVVPERVLDQAWSEASGATAGERRISAELAEEEQEAMARIDRSEYVGLTFEELDQVAAIGAWSGDELLC